MIIIYVNDGRETRRYCYFSPKLAVEKYVRERNKGYAVSSATITL